MLRAIYQSTSEAITFIDKNLIIRYNNQVARNITKQIFGKEAQAGDYSLDYFLPEYRAEFADFYQRVLNGESITLERAEGTNWWQLSMYPVLNEQKEIIGIASNVQDITERKTKEIQLQEAEQKLQKIIEAIPHAFLVVNEEAEITYVNKEFEKAFGYTESEVIGKKVDFLIPERFRAGHSILQQNYMKKEGTPRMGRYLPAITRAGEEILMNISLNTFSAEGKKYAIAILEDVTELKQQQDIIFKQNEILYEIARQQSHEIRRPVANLLGLCDLLKNYKDETEEMKNKYIDLVLQETQELDKVIRQIVYQANKNLVKDRAK